ncbi:hypothetical protein NDU88_003710 [Pleurodeles waltl]|uniref:Uncharacterized protein n=1 Tax=Pleurodeles waltl TaxID=8319 RepID=A0AAV7VE26_PLEWA|nr:hypothetical protein NDU88_003710 [Pleurodeles waltl]
MLLVAPSGRQALRLIGEHGLALPAARAISPESGRRRRGAFGAGTHLNDRRLADYRGPGDWKGLRRTKHLRTDHHKLVDRVKAIKTTLEELQPTHRALRVQVTHLSEQVQELEHRSEDAEGCNQHNNVRTIGMREGVEEPDAVTYLETWLRTLMGE